MLDLELLDAARADLANIWHTGVLRWGEAQAERYADAIEASLQRLRDNPCMGSSRPQLLPEMRVLIVRRHLAFYRVVGDRIEVIRILHHSMDATRHLRDT